MRIYIDTEFKCHTANPDGIYREMETDFFDSKCEAFIQGYRFVPKGESWTRSDGVVFQGEMVAPWMPYDELDAAQREYERQQIAEYEKALAEIEAALGV
jgi:hypothetical protein